MMEIGDSVDNVERAKEKKGKTKWEERKKKLFDFDEERRIGAELQKKLG
jgi:hypothetical protein